MLLRTNSIYTVLAGGVYYHSSGLKDIKMNKREKMLILSVILLVGVVGVIVGYVHYLMQFGADAAREVSQSKIRLLSTDHQALLGACRELSRQVASGGLKSGTYVAPEVLRFPEPIPTLRPNHVTIDRDGLVKIEMGTGRSPLGVCAYPEGYPRYPPPFKYGDRRLLEGLWYYEDGYSTHPEAFDRKIDEILRGKPGTRY